MLRFCRGFLRAHERFYADRALAVRLAEQEAGIAPRYAEAAWDDYTREAIFPRDGEASEAGVQALIDISALIRELPSRPRRAADYIDRRWLAAARELAAMIDYGDRARLGLLVPSGNRVAEPELQAMLPPGVTALVTRLELRGSSEPELLHMIGALEPAARLLADARTGAHRLPLHRRLDLRPGHGRPTSAPGSRPPPASPPAPPRMASSPPWHGSGPAAAAGDPLHRRGA